MSRLTQRVGPECERGPMELAGGALVFLVFVVVYGLAVIHGLYSRSGSGITPRPWRNERLAHEPLRFARGTR